ncbi:vacuolar fusion protein CCZ1 homolog [Orussus abietinus]|uniref:vacuolar fusion protein CCZ1 homolog n=1 Tax=Orussus abietinus TaxID=222816 RepID=UPI0006268920|nr:vacuolar fusion protein CCZ1 homolog [Orussus abietinus]XP_012273188.1 vacuolar fusion protein CCZ1 homolog [Orussus abietinus]XP_012273189.1 vacuolar fusion protein CCZ1 homolog [Orussus abietinus]XP_012273190.1 vacuolar fusion protein CCZ1 homolog [Orussus abietinus]
MTAKSDVTLEHFYIFNGTYAKKEGEEENKILYYYPTKTDIDTKIRNIGLSEAIIKFTESFNPGQPCDYCHTHKTRQVYYQPEPNFWMVMVVGIPYVWKVKDGNKYMEYQNDKVSSTVCQAVLKQAYAMFRLFMGSFSTILSEPDCGSITLLKYKLDHFYSWYLLSLNLNNSNIVDIFQGLLFLPLDKTTLLRVQCFMNLIEAMFSQVKYTAFVYNDQLVWSGLEPEDMQVVYHYLVTRLLPAHLEKELYGGSVPRQSPSPFTSSHYGKFVTGPASIHEPSGTVPKVFINYNTKPVSLYLIVYRSLSATICLFVDGKSSLVMDFFKSLDTFLGPQLTTLVSAVAEQCSKHTSPAAELYPKYVYFNKLNLAYKSTIHSDNRRCSNVLVTSEVLRVMTDINNDMDRLQNAGEIVIKTMSDFWVVGKLSNLRKFFVVIQVKSSTLIEVEDEVKRICDEELKGIFFQ